MNATASVALLGLPSTGKTTYLAALYNLLESAGPNADERLRSLPPHRLYLEEIRDAWLAGLAVPRTPVGTGEIVELEAVMRGEPLDLRIPDVSGESFAEALTTRHIDAGLAAAVREATGLLLFTNPSELRPRVLLSRTEGLGLDDSAGGDELDFDPATTLPAETQLVDLLQWAVRLRHRHEPLPAAVVVSMWDELPAGATTQMWLAQMPLLRQYAASTADAVDIRVFGVSAQGGRYGGDQDPAAMPPAERPFVVDPDGDRANDITLPLRWAALP